MKKILSIALAFLPIALPAQTAEFTALFDARPVQSGPAFELNRQHFLAQPAVVDAVIQPWLANDTELPAVEGKPLYWPAAVSAYLAQNSDTPRTTKLNLALRAGGLHRWTFSRLVTLAEYNQIKTSNWTFGGRTLDEGVRVTLAIRFLDQDLVFPNVAVTHFNGNAGIEYIRWVTAKNATFTNPQEAYTWLQGQVARFEPMLGGQKDNIITELGKLLDRRYEQINTAN